MLTPEYMRLRLDIIPDKIVMNYNLYNLVDNKEWVNIKFTKKCMAFPEWAF
jgi:hypothetical protein